MLMLYIYLIMLCIITMYNGLFYITDYHRLLCLAFPESWDGSQCLVATSE